MASIFYSDGVPAVSHFSFAIFFAFAFVAARFLLDKFIFRRLATWMLSTETTTLKINEATKAKIVKCSESMWKLTYYATVEFCVLKIAYHEPWFRDITKYFSGWPDQKLMLPLTLVYMCQCGFYVYSIVALLTWETRRKDFSVMMSHHVITVILIAYSYISRFFRIGSVILALHDASDVFLEAAKVFKYSGKELGASVLFGLFAISWFLLRLVVFPFWVIRSSSYYLCGALRLSEAYDTALYYAFNTLLLTLLVFHIYWWIMICAMITRQLKNRGKVGEDIRSGVWRLHAQVTFTLSFMLGKCYFHRQKSFCHGWYNQKHVVHALDGCAIYSKSSLAHGSSHFIHTYVHTSSIICN